MQKLFELVGASGERHDDVDGDAGGVHPLVLHFHKRAEWAEQDQLPELSALLATKRHLVQGPFVLFCASYPYKRGGKRREEEVERRRERRREEKEGRRRGEEGKRILEKALDVVDIIC